MNQSINTVIKNSKEPQQKYRLGTVSIKILGGLKPVLQAPNLALSFYQLNLTNLTCSDHNGSYCLPVLDQHKHHTLEKLKLKLPVSGLLLQSLEESQFRLLTGGRGSVTVNCPYQISNGQRSLCWHDFTRSAKSVWHGRP